MALLLGFLVTTAYLPLPDPARMPRWAVLSIMIPIFVLKSKARIPRLAIVVIAYAALSLAWSPDPWAGADILWHFVLLACLFSLNLDLRSVLIGVGFGLALNTLVFVAQVFGFTGIFEMDASKPSGLFANRNAQAELVAMAVVGLVAVRVYVLAAVSAVPLFALPLARGPLVALAAASCIALPKRWRIAAILAAVAGLAWLLAADQFAGITSALARVLLWDQMLYTMTPFGNGLGAFGHEFPLWEFAHNDTLQILYELGIPGTVAWAGIVGFCLWRAEGAAAAVLVAFLVEGCFAFPLFHPATAFLAACAAAYGLRLCAREPLREPLDLGWRSEQGHTPVRRHA